MAKQGIRDWYVWGALALGSFAILEGRALRSGGQRATLSHVCRTHARRSPATKAATVAFGTWFTYHVVWEKLREELS